MANTERKENFNISPFSAKGISHLSLYQFRNYLSLNLDIAEGPIVLTGPNGAGKTNVLEAISLFSPGRGLRGAKGSEIIPHHLLSTDQKGLLWGASLQLDQETQLATGLERTIQNTEKRLNKIHYEAVKTQAAFTEWLNIVWLTPETDRIFLEGPSVRRKFIDRLIYAHDPLHLERVQRYEQILKERLMVLRNQNDSRWLNSLEEQLANYGVAIAVARQQLMQKLNKGQDYHHNLFPTFISQMTGDIDQWVQEKPATEAEDQLRQTFQQNRRLDCESGTTKCGPHRSDWQIIYYQKKVLAEFASTGEQKILLMAVILSFIHNKVRMDHRLTILLLDDVIAHLDFHHRMVLFEQISALQSLTDSQSHIQTWLTGTDALLFESLIGKAQFFMVEHATITSG